MKNLSENLVILFFSILLLLVAFLVASPSMASPLISEVTNETSKGAVVNGVMDELHATTLAADQAYININTASATEIAAAIRGIGLKKADAIVAYRRTHGPFKTIESLTAVKGIGDKTLSRNKGVIRIE